METSGAVGADAERSQKFSRIASTLQ
jgi:hypothetical protein